MKQISNNRFKLTQQITHLKLIKTCDKNLMLICAYINMTSLLFVAGKRSCNSLVIGFMAALLRLHHKSQCISPRDDGQYNHYTHLGCSNAFGADNYRSTLVQSRPLQRILTTEAYITHYNKQQLM
jgi:hypothetical protein